MLATRGTSRLRYRVASATSPRAARRPRHGRPRLVERAAHALAVVRRRGVALLAQRRLLAAAHVLAAHDPVVVAVADPVEQLAHALDRERVGDLEVLEQPREPLD